MFLHIGILKSFTVVFVYVCVCFYFILFRVSSLTYKSTLKKNPKRNTRFKDGIKLVLMFCPRFKTIFPFAVHISLSPPLIFFTFSPTFFVIVNVFLCFIISPHVVWTHVRKFVRIDTLTNFHFSCACGCLSLALFPPFSFVAVTG